MTWTFEISSRAKQQIRSLPAPVRPAALGLLAELQRDPKGRSHEVRAVQSSRVHRVADCLTR